MSFELDLSLPKCSDSWMVVAFEFWPKVSLVVAFVFWLKVSLAMGVG